LTPFPLGGIIHTSLQGEPLNLRDLEITPDTHPLLIQLSHCYQPQGEAPGRAELLARQYPDDYKLPQVSGWLTFKSLVLQAGYNLDEELKKAEAAMNRAMDTTTED